MVAQREARIDLATRSRRIRVEKVDPWDGRSLALIYRTSCASGDFQDVVVVDVKPSPQENPADGRVVLQTRSAVDPHTLTLKEAARLSVKVEGRFVDIDARAPGVPRKH